MNELLVLVYSIDMYLISFDVLFNTQAIQKFRLKYREQKEHDAKADTKQAS